MIFHWSQLKRFADQVEGYIRSDIADIALSDDEQSRVESDAGGGLAGLLHQDVWERRDIFPHALRRSVVLATWTLLESHVEELADSVAEESGLPIRARELRGGVFHRSVRFIGRVEGFEPKELEDWKDMMGLNRARNLLAHGNGWVPPNRFSDIESFVKKAPGFELLPMVGSDDHVLEVEAEAVRYSIDLCARFMNTLIKRSARR